MTYIVLVNYYIRQILHLKRSGEKDWWSKQANIASDKNCIRQIFRLKKKWRERLVEQTSNQSAASHSTGDCARVTYHRRRRDIFSRFFIVRQKLMSWSYFSWYLGHIGPDGCIAPRDPSLNSHLLQYSNRNTSRNIFMGSRSDH